MKQIFETKSVKRKATRTPGGKQVYNYRKKKVKTATCSNCKAKLGGIPRLRQSGINKLPKTKKRPERPYSGVLCAKCLEEAIKEKLATTTKVEKDGSN
ncbi:MAG: 50S ribosomal protein L34e [archaeon]|nr:50S ribosomal protein L34e [archaeon]